MQVRQPPPLNVWAGGTVPSSRPLSTGEAAKQLGIARWTLVRWWQDGTVKPQFITAGGHARWDMPDLMRQLRDWRAQD